MVDGRAFIGRLQMSKNKTVTYKQLDEVHGIPRTTMWRLTKRDDFPQDIRIKTANLVHFDLVKLKAWLKTVGVQS